LLPAVNTLVKGPNGLDLKIGVLGGEKTRDRDQCINLEIKNKKSLA